MASPRHAKRSSDEGLFKGRDPALDGLRGLAAADVVVHHLLLVSASYTAIRTVAPSAMSTSQLFLWFSPMQICVLGGPAVWIFFILSGFVLSRPYLRGRQMDVGRYYSRRVVRLYLPLFASGLFAVVLFDLVARHTQPGMSAFIAGQSVAGSVKDFVFTMLLLGGSHSHGLNAVWWSLQWEVWFSLALPLVVIAFRPLRRQWFVTIVAMIACSAIGQRLINSGHPTLHHGIKYLPMFLIGVALVHGEPQLRRAVETLRGKVVVPLVALSVLCLSWVEILLARGAGISQKDLSALLIALVLAGATSIMILALCWSPFERVLTTRPVHWLGQRSYSLYLIHAPIVVTLAFAMKLHTVTVPFVLVVLPLILLATEIFYKVVEIPTLRLVARLKAQKPVPVMAQ